MDNIIQEYVGSRIKFYRKHKGMSLDDLARKIHKSKASVSKYEKGQVSIDITTLCDIADALGVAPSQFLNHLPDYGQQQQNKDINPFGETTKLYLYHYHLKTVFSSILTIGPDDGTGHLSATMYYKTDDPDKLERCDCIYHGQMYSHDTVISIFMRNYHNPVENCLLIFTFPMRKASVLTGMISGLGSNTLVPTAHKILLSKDALNANKDLESQLTINPTVFKSMKKGNAFYIPLE